MNGGMHPVGTWEREDRGKAVPTLDHPPGTALMRERWVESGRGRGPGEWIPTGNHPPRAVLMGGSAGRTREARVAD